MLLELCCFLLWSLLSLLRIRVTLCMTLLLLSILCNNLVRSVCNSIFRNVFEVILRFILLVGLGDVAQQIRWVIQSFFIIIFLKVLLVRVLLSLFWTLAMLDSTGNPSTCRPSSFIHNNFTVICWDYLALLVPNCTDTCITVYILVTMRLLIYPVLLGDLLLVFMRLPLFLCNIMVAIFLILRIIGLKICRIFLLFNNVIDLVLWNLLLLILRTVLLTWISHLCMICQVINFFNIWSSLIPVWTRIESLWDISFVDFNCLDTIVSIIIFIILWINYLRWLILFGLLCHLRLYHWVSMLLLNKLTLLRYSLTWLYMSGNLLDLSWILRYHNIWLLELFLILNLNSRLINIGVCFLNIFFITSLNIAFRQFLFFLRIDLRVISKHLWLLDLNLLRWLNFAQFTVVFTGGV